MILPSHSGQARKRPLCLERFWADVGVGAVSTVSIVVHLDIFEYSFLHSAPRHKTLTTHRSECTITPADIFASTTYPERVAHQRGRHAFHSSTDAYRCPCMLALFFQALRAKFDARVPKHPPPRRREQQTRMAGQ